RPERSGGEGNPPTHSNAMDPLPGPFGPPGMTRVAAWGRHPPCHSRPEAAEAAGGEGNPPMQSKAMDPLPGCCAAAGDDTPLFLKGLGDGAGFPSDAPAAL